MKHRQDPLPLRVVTKGILQQQCALMSEYADQADRIRQLFACVRENIERLGEKLHREAGDDATKLMVEGIDVYRFAQEIVQIRTAVRDTHFRRMVLNEKKSSRLN